MCLNAHSQIRMVQIICETVLCFLPSQNFFPFLQLKVKSGERDIREQII